MPARTTCPFCSRTRLTATGATDLLVHYRCDFCFKQWGAARVDRTLVVNSSGGREPRGAFAHGTIASVNPEG